MRNDINSLGPGAQIEMQASAQTYLNQTSSSSSSWMSCLGGDIVGGGGQHHMIAGTGGQVGGIAGGMAGAVMMGAPGSYEQLGGVMGTTAAGFGSDEEDCFDQISDQEGGGDDSVSSSGVGANGTGGASGLDDTRIQQL